MRFLDHDGSEPRCSIQVLLHDDKVVGFILGNISDTFYCKEHQIDKWNNLAMYAHHSLYFELIKIRE